MTHPIDDNFAPSAPLDAFIAERGSLNQALARQTQGFIRFGKGVPSQAPVAGSGIYFRLDGAPGSNVYAYDSTAWVPIA